MNRVGHLWWVWLLLGIVRIIAAVLIPQFVVVGILWMIEAFLSKEHNDIWWLGLTSGILMLVLGFMASGQLFVEKAYTLMIFTGIWLLMKGRVLGVCATPW